MKLREAILAAANHIQLNPESFSFWNNEIPHNTAVTACALGWIVHFSAGPRYGWQWSSQTAGREVLGMEAHKFYAELDRLGEDPYWRRGAQACASVLRRYADEHHPVEEAA